MKDIRQNTIGPILALLASQACSSYVKLLYGASLGTKFWREKETILFIAPCESREIISVNMSVKAKKSLSAKKQKESPHWVEENVAPATEEKLWQKGKKIASIQQAHS